MTDTGTDDTPTDGAVRVLVVSADEDAARFLAALLEREGFDTITDGVERAAAATLASDPAPGLVVVDTEPEAARSIRSLADADLARVPIAVLGAPHTKADADAETAATDAGADAWIARPVDDTELLAVVRRLTGD